jgi:hypothetical protein
VQQRRGSRPDSAQSSAKAALKLSGVVDQAIRQIMPPPCDTLNRRAYDAAWPIDGNPNVLVEDADGTPPINQSLVIRSVVQAGGHGALLSHDGHFMLIPTDATSAKVLDTTTNQVLVELLGTGGAIHRAVWSPDSRWIITISTTAAARVWDAARGIAADTNTADQHATGNIDADAD